MQIGCGVYEHSVRGRLYLYFWHYESQGGRRNQVSEYVGPARAARARQEALHRVEAYFDRMAVEFHRLRSGTVASLAGPR